MSSVLDLGSCGSSGGTLRHLELRGAVRKQSWESQQVGRGLGGGSGEVPREKRMRRFSEHVSRSSPDGPGTQVPDLASFLEEVAQTPGPCIRESQIVGGRRLEEFRTMGRVAGCLR